MSKNQNRHHEPFTQNQNNAMSVDDLRDGSRNTNKPEEHDGGPPGSAPDEQSEERLRELGEQGHRRPQPSGE